MAGWLTKLNALLHAYTFMLVTWNPFDWYTTVWDTLLSLVMMTSKTDETKGCVRTSVSVLWKCAQVCQRYGFQVQAKGFPEA